MKSSGVLLSVFAAAVAMATPAGAGNPYASQQTAAVVTTMVGIGCTNPGSSQDVAKTPTLKNTTSATIPKGKVLQWTSSDGDSGNFTLAADLAPNATVNVSGRPNNGYTCQARFNGGEPDLSITKIIPTNTTLSADISNSNPWIQAGASVAKLSVFTCGVDAPTKTLTVSIPAVAKASKQTATFAVQIPANSYYVITADATNLVKESNENNNYVSTQGVCIH